MSAPPSAGSGSPEDLVRVLRAEGIRDRRVLDAFRQVPRTRFVPREAAGRAYLDEPIGIPHGQVTTQPSLIARMVAALGLSGTERVLEVGTGLGFQTAILAFWPGCPTRCSRSSASQTWPPRRGPTWPRPGWAASR